MALYASDGDSWIFAGDADPKNFYRCLDCLSPVRVRRARYRTPHFYHLQRSPRCRLYSKSEDHLLLQLQIQKILGDETTQIERPFPSIHRIADLLWEKENIVFEIQCSSLVLEEAQKRTNDYRKIGHNVVWLLDDRIFNRRFVRPSETFMRNQLCYFFTFNRSGPSYVYDQMELFVENKRVKKGSPLKVDLARPRIKPFIEWPPNLLTQIHKRLEANERYFQGDLVHLQIQTANRPSVARYLEKWKTWEIESRERPKSGLIAHFLKHRILRPYLQALDRLIDWVNT